MKKIKTIILIMLIVCIIISIFLAVSIINITKEQSNTNLENSNLLAEELKEQNEEINTNLEKVRYRNVYYAIEKCVNKYIEAIKFEDKLAIYNMLDEEYKQSYNISSNNVLNHIKKLDNTYTIENMYAKQENKNCCNYYIFGEIMNNNVNKEYNIVVKINSEDLHFSIIPNEYLQEKNVKTINEIDNINFRSLEINNTNYNTYYYDEISDKEMLEIYINNYIGNIKNNLNASYTLLDEEYRKNRFSTLTNYITYIKNNEQYLFNIKIKEYEFEEYENYNIYKFKDQYGNTYIFKETAIMEYTVMLDDYTLETETFKQKYEKASDKEKGHMNIEKFFEMINMRDYSSAYSLLDENFKQNNFKTVADFEKYMQTKTYRYNKVNYKTYTNQISSIYIYTIGLTDRTGEKSEEIEFNIVMKLLEGTDFVMSFTAK